jgi:hypothetical protein
MAKVDVKKLRGLKALLQDVVTNGATSIQQVHMGTTARTFRILEQIPAVSGPSQVVRMVHDTIVTTAYAATRGVTEAIGSGIDLALDAVDDEPSTAHTENPDDAT